MAAVLLVLGTPLARAQLVGQDCTPIWGIPFLKEKANPESFWTSVLLELKQKAEATKIQYELFQIEQRQDKANLRFEAEKSRVMGIPQYTTPQLEKQLADGQQFTDDLNDKLTRSALEMTERCAAHARAQLSHMRSRANK